MKEKFGILHSSVYTFQECGRQEINSFVRTFWCQVSGVRCQVSGVRCQELKKQDLKPEH